MTTPQDTPSGGPLEGEDIEIRGSLTCEGEEPAYGRWFPAVVASQARVAEETRKTHFLVITPDDKGNRLMFRAYADEGKTWQRVPVVRRG